MFQISWNLLFILFFIFRNLFFRTSSLLKNGIDPVYVLEGQAPELKAQTMKKRQEARYGVSQQSSANPKETSSAPSRSRYKHIQKECKDLLDSLGVATIESKGEAEAACAGLNRQGAVDGCITVDGDCFLYGAKTVYRNLSTDTSHFVCQEYSMELIETRLNLSRDKLIVLAVLLGCDYLPDGIPGVGKESALRVLSSWKGVQPQEVVLSWLSNSAVDYVIPPRPAHCSQCKHPGSLRGHAKNGCAFCDVSSGCKSSSDACQCEWHLNEPVYEEYNMRSKLAQMNDIDLKAIFDEFSNDVHMQHRGSPIPQWQMPSIKTFVQLATSKLKWESSYAAEKVLPLLRQDFYSYMNTLYTMLTFSVCFSRWVVIHGAGHQDSAPIVPKSVFSKKRVQRGCPFYEVEWEFKKECEGFPLVFQTLEPQFLVEREFRHLLPQPVPKPVKQARAKKGKPGPAKKTGKNLDVVTMFEKMRLETDATKSRSPNVSALDLTAGTDDDADLSAIVDIICQRKKNTSPPCRVNALTETVAIAAPTAIDPPLPNFSLNFSLERLLEASELSGRCDSPREATSTPIPAKRLPGHLLVREEQDSFATPPPLADRFSRLHIWWLQSICCILIGYRGTYFRTSPHAFMALSAIILHCCIKYVLCYQTANTFDK